MADKRSSWCRTILDLIVQQWFLIGLGIAILIASQVQIPRQQVPLAEKIVSYTCVSLIFLITGFTLPTNALLENYRRWQVHIYVQVQCFLVTSALSFGIVSACAVSRNFLDAGLLIGLIFAGCTPTTISSNVVMTANARGNHALTVAESTLGNFLGPFLTPALLQMYLSCGAWYTESLPSRHGDYAAMYSRVFMQIGLSVFLPMVIGQILQKYSPSEVRNTLKRWQISRINTCCLIVIIWQAYDQAFGSSAFDSIPSNNIIFVVFISVTNYILWLVVSVGFLMPWCAREDITSVAYCVPAKSPAMGVPIGNLIFVGLSTSMKSRIQVPLLVYQGIQIALGSILVPAFRAWNSTEKINGGVGRQVDENAEDRLEERRHDPASTDDRGTVLIPNQ